MTENIRIPQARVAIVIGKSGETKKQIEQSTQTILSISSDGNVQIEKKKDALDPLAEWTARDIVKAISRGFSPEKAYDLLEEDVVLEIVELKEFTGKSPKQMERIKSRIIGRAGKCRERIESSTETDISIYGKTVSVIGRMDGVSIAKEAIIKLANGQMHSTVYRFLDMRRKVH